MSRNQERRFTGWEDGEPEECDEFFEEVLLKNLSREMKILFYMMNLDHNLYALTSLSCRTICSRQTSVGGWDGGRGSFIVKGRG